MRSRLKLVKRMSLILQVLNCIVDMVEKTRRSVSVLRRCQESDREELNYWRRRSSEQEDPRKGGSGSAPFSKTHSPHSSEPGGYHSLQSSEANFCAKRWEICALDTALNASSEFIYSSDMRRWKKPQLSIAFENHLIGSHTSLLPKPFQ